MIEFSMKLVVLTEDSLRGTAEYLVDIDTGELTVLRRLAFLIEWLRARPRVRVDESPLNMGVDKPLVPWV